MAFRLSTPSKTFILGEYLALMGGPTLVAATDKRFELAVDFTGHKTLTGIHQDSPAGLMYGQFADMFDGLEISFIDPYNGAGGLGASSAQFVMMSALKKMLEHGLKTCFEELNPHTVWTEYRNIFANTENWLPSGADVVNQLVGGITHFQWKPFKVERLSWDLTDLSFLIFKTPNKVSTHEHLSQLQNIDIEKLDHIASTTSFALKEQDAFQFVKGVTQYHEELEAQSLVCDESLELIDNLKKTDQVISVKGCGALGADTLFVVCEKQNVENLKGLAKVVGLQLIATNTTVSQGLKFDFNYDFKKHHVISRTNRTEVSL